MNIKDVPRALGINKTGEMSRNKAYVVDIEDMDEFGKIYSLLDKNEDCEELDDNSLINLHNVSYLCIYDDFQLNLLADFDQDSYKLVINALEDVKKSNEDNEKVEQEEEEEDVEGNNN